MFQREFPHIACDPHQSIKGGIPLSFASGMRSSSSCCQTFFFSQGQWQSTSVFYSAWAKLGVPLLHHLVVCQFGSSFGKVSALECWFNNYYHRCHTFCPPMPVCKSLWSGLAYVSLRLMPWKITHDVIWNGQLGGQVVRTSVLQFRVLHLNLSSGLLCFVHFAWFSPRMCLFSPYTVRWSPPTFPRIHGSFIQDP